MVVVVPSREVPAEVPAGADWWVVISPPAAGRRSAVGSRMTAQASSGRDSDGQHRAGRPARHKTNDDQEDEEEEEEEEKGKWEENESGHADGKDGQQRHQREPKSDMKHRSSNSSSTAAVWQRQQKIQH